MARPKPKYRPDREYVIAQPLEHTVLSFYTPAVEPPSEKRPKEERGEFQQPEPGTKKRALWVVHGMGQQVPFETLDAFAEGVLKAAKAAGWIAGKANLRFRNVKLWDAAIPTKTQLVQRVEMDIHNPAPQPGEPTDLELHLYEAYWAPITEGVAKITDVLSFLYDGAGHGLVNCIRQFRRAMFGGIRKFEIRKRTAFEILGLLAVVAALGAINAAILAASAAKLKFSVSGPWLTDNYWNQMTAIASAVTALAISFGAVLFFAEMSKPAAVAPGVRGVITVLGWLGVGGAALSIVLAGFFLWLIPFSTRVATWFRGMHYHATQFVSTVGILAALLLCLIGLALRALSKFLGQDPREGFLPFLLFLFSYLLHALTLFLLIAVHFQPFALLYHRYFNPASLPKWVIFLAGPYWVWPTLLFLSKKIRDVIVEYPGDVAIYVAPNKLDRFDVARQKIKQLALDSLAALYAARGLGPGGVDLETVQLYETIGVVGHSLGSVIAYDALNKLSVLDDLLNQKFGVAERTRVFETFGSPLDKTAFFFTYQGKNTIDIHEQLASCVQPLIQNYARFRRFAWINVYSPNDIISGKLKFYDTVPPPPPPPPPGVDPVVDNVEDPDAIVPLIAHVDYWKNDTAWDKLFAEIIKP